MSPVRWNILDQKPPQGAKRKFEERTGRQIYDEFSISALNIVPIGILISYIIGDSKFDKAPFNVEELTERLLVDGSVVIRADEFLDNVEEVGEKLVIQKLDGAGPGGGPLHRVFRRDEPDADVWYMEDYENYGLKSERVVVSRINLLPRELFPYINGKGILFSPQKTYWRIERIFETMEKKTTGAGLVKKLVSGYLGNIAKLQENMESEAEIVGIPEGGNTKVHDLVTNTIVDQQIAQLDQLVPLWKEALHVIDTSEAASISGISRRLMMTPMTTFVEKVRGWLIEVCEYFKYVPVFAQLPLVPVEERQKEYELLKQYLADGVITREQFTKKAGEVIA